MKWLASAAVALALVVLSGDLPGSPWSDVVAAATWSAGLLALGKAFGRRAAVSFGVCLVVGAVAAELLRDPVPIDQQNSGDVGPGFVIFALPIFFMLIAAGAWLRGRRPPRRAAGSPPADTV